MNKKKIKLSNKEILQKITALESVVAKQLPIRASYAVSKNVEIINKELEFYNKENSKLVKKYAKKDDNETPVKDKKGKILLDEPEEFKKEYNELLKIEIELEIYMCKIENLGDKDFSAAELTAIKFMLEDY